MFGSFFICLILAIPIVTFRLSPQTLHTVHNHSSQELATVYFSFNTFCILYSMCYFSIKKQQELLQLYSMCYFSIKKQQELLQLYTLFIKLERDQWNLMQTYTNHSTI